MTQLAGSLVILLTLALVATPLAAEAQQAGKVYRLGILTVDEPQVAASVRRLYAKRLSELGWQEGRNLSIDLRHTRAADRTGELAASLVAANPDVLIGIGPYPAHSLKDATRTIPIVLAGIADPVGRGLVASLARPGGNITGVSHLTGTGIGFGGKEWQILKEFLPRAERFALLYNPANPRFKNLNIRESFAPAQREYKITIQNVEARTVDEIPTAIEAAVRLGAEGLFVSPDPVLGAGWKTILELAAKHKLPAIYPFSAYARAGGLVSYGTDWAALLRRSADYVDKILRGTNPADLPIEQPTKLELVINLKTAKALGLTIPQSLLLRADKVIE